jgi:hypothetical protein
MSVFVVTSQSSEDREGAESVLDTTLDDEARFHRSRQHGPAVATPKRGWVLDVNPPAKASSQVGCQPWIRGGLAEVFAEFRCGTANQACERRGQFVAVVQLVGEVVELRIQENVIGAPDSLVLPRELGSEVVRFRSLEPSELSTPP